MTRYQVRARDARGVWAVYLVTELAPSYAVYAAWRASPCGDNWEELHVEPAPEGEVVGAVDLDGEEDGNG